MSSIQQQLKDLVEKINLFAPIKEGQVIFKKDNDEIILIKKNKEVKIIEEIKKDLPYIELNFNDIEDMRYLTESKDLKDYGSRLFKLSVLDQKVTLKTSNIKNLTREGYYRFISHTRGRYKFEIIVPIM